jgi:hypothetical protein
MGKATLIDCQVPQRDDDRQSEMIAGYAKRDLEAMYRRVGAVMVVVIAMAVPVLAQVPLSPIYPTVPRNSPQPGASKAITAVPATTNAAPAAKPEAAPASTAVATPSQGDIPVATAAIPPPFPSTPPANALPQRPATALSPLERAAAVAPNVRRQTRTARHKRYARRTYARWYYGYGVPITGWGGGQYGPAPYSASGP